MLSIKQRQTYLKTLGFYTGMVDGKEGPLTKKAYLKLQKTYFIRKSDIDGVYGKNTDILLRCAYNVWKYCKNFKLDEFKCECKGKYCTGYPKELDKNLLMYLQSIRSELKVATTITSGIRCQKYNDSLTGSIKDSKHTKGKAVDFCNSKTTTLTKRKSIIDKYIKNKYARYSYCNSYYHSIWGKGYISASYMGTSIHIDVK
jgi:hypothetical protein